MAIALRITTFALRQLIARPASALILACGVLVPALIGAWSACFLGSSISFLTRCYYDAALFGSMLGAALIVQLLERHSWLRERLTLRSCLISDLAALIAGSTGLVALTLGAWTSLVPTGAAAIGSTAWIALGAVQLRLGSLGLLLLRCRLRTGVAALLLIVISCLAQAVQPAHGAFASNWSAGLADLGSILALLSATLLLERSYGRRS